MNSRIATITLVAVASILAATIAVSTFAGSASALRQVSGGGNSQGAAQGANNNGLAGVNVAVGVQDVLNNLCVAALTSTGCA
jgi:FlaG/FlaF family flagellin (archaellin)